MREFCLAIAILLLPAVSTAQNYNSGRAQTWDFSVAVIHQQPDIATAGGGSFVDIDDEFGFGFSLGYNLSDHLNISADFDFLSPDYVATLVVEPNPPDGSNTITTIDHELNQFNGRLKGTFYLTDGPFVPFVEVGAGWTYLDSNIASGPPTGFCWWHPWWGYICETFVDTFSSTEFTYGGAVGFRYETASNSFIKASYSLWVLDTGSAIADPQFESIRLEYGWRF